MSRTLPHLPLLAFAAALPFLPAQQLTAHPQETLLNTSGNIAPFGIAGSGGFAESRCQILVPRQELAATPGPLVAIEVHALSPGPVNYAQLEIRIAATTATTLSTTFAQNFGSASTLVLQASNFQITYGSACSSNSRSNTMAPVASSSRSARSRSRCPTSRSSRWPRARHRRGPIDR